MYMYVAASQSFSVYKTHKQGDRCVLYGYKSLTMHSKQTRQHVGIVPTGVLGIETSVYVSNAIKKKAWRGKRRSWA